WAEHNGWVTREFTVTIDAARTLIDRGLPFTLATVEPVSAHLQAVIGYDTTLQTVIVRDPLRRSSRELPVEMLAERYAATGPRGLVLVPEDQAARLDDLVLPDSEQYDCHHRLQRALVDHDRDKARCCEHVMVERWPCHRLTHWAAFSIAAYDGDDSRCLKAID